MSARDLAPPLSRWSSLGGRAFKTGVNALLTGAWLALLGVPACGNKEPLPAARSGPGSHDLDPAQLCATPNQGCPCEGDAEVVECGKVVEKHDDYVTCSLGHRSCDDGSWSACVGERTTQATVQGQPPAGAGYRIQALGAGAECPPGFDPCDPYCHQFTDEPGDFPAGAGFENANDGLSLAESVAAGCTSLSLSASATTLHVNQLSPLTLAEGAITLTAALTPATCRPVPFKTTWTLDRFDVAQVTGTNNQDGSLSVTSPYAGDVLVTAYAAGLEASLTLRVVVNVLDAPTTNALATPNSAASAAQRTSFGTLAAPLAGSAATTATWLYPYAATYFPLGLPPPALLYRYSAAGGGAVKVSLRYPTGKTATGADFNYSLIVKETNSISQSANVPANTLDPQVVVPAIAWQAFEQTARGNDAELIVQRLPASGTLEQASARPIHFVNGQLKGTVYYNSYSSPQGGDTGAVLSIAPGANSPALAVQPGGKCTVCHSVNVSGTRLISNGVGKMNQSRRFDLTQGAAPSPTVLNSYNPPAGDVANVPGDRFTYGAPLTDGAFYMTHGGYASGDPNFRAPPAFSNLYSVDAPNTIVNVTGWPANMQAVTPRFSVDGTRRIFGFWSGDAVDGLMAAGTRLAVVDFACTGAPCGVNSTGFSVSNARDLTPGLTHKTAWPSFTPDGSVVLYQRQYRSSNSLSAWSPSEVNTSTGSLAQIWASDVPASSATAATPTPLTNLNGVNLPARPRTVVDDTKPLYTFPVIRFDMSQSGAVSPSGVYLTGMPTTSSTDALAASDLRLKITVGGPRGTAKFRYSTNGGTTYSGTDLTTSATPVAIGNGLSAVFAAGTYVAASAPMVTPVVVATVYRTLVGYVTLGGTPQGGPWDFRIGITTGGALGTSQFRYSTDGGVNWSAPQATAATASLGTTGMVASFAAATYSAGEGWGALVSNYHDPNATFTVNVADNCQASLTATGVNDSQLNYVPSVNPTEAGDKSWVVFTSRRMYGNVAYDDPWDAEPAATNHTHYSCNSSTPPTKKLWVSALDQDFSPGTDPSHPAFYLPGQELAAGNSHAYWVSTPCAETGATCSTSDDCCDGSGTDPTARCNGSSKVCQSIDDCAPAGGGCATSADCCEGVVCNGSGQCTNPVFFSTETFEREYIAKCPDGYKVAWRDFEWQATIPSGTSIDLAVQTKPEDDAAYEPDPGAPLDSISETTLAGEWVHGTATADEALASADVGSRSYLRVSMTFNPDVNGEISPVLTAWRQNYDCLPAE